MTYCYDILDYSESSEDVYDVNEEEDARPPCTQSSANIIDEMLKHSSLNEIKSYFDENLNLTNNTDFSENNGWNLVLKAANYGRHDVIEMLLNEGIQIEMDHNLFNPLISCIKGVAVDENKIIRCMDIFLKGQANIDEVDEYGNTALMIAANKGFFDVCFFLIGKGADINCSNIDGMTALAYACENSHRDITMLLLEKGADKYFVTKNGCTLRDMSKSMKVRNLFYHLDHLKDSVVAETDALYIALSGLGLENLYEKLHYQNIDLSILKKLDDQKLQDAGVTNANDRRIIMDFFSPQSASASAQMMTHTGRIRVLNNIRQHCNYLTSLLTCLRTDDKPAFCDHPAITKQNVYISKTIRLCDDYLKVFERCSGEYSNHTDTYKKRVFKIAFGVIIVGCALCYSCHHK